MFHWAFLGASPRQSSVLARWSLLGLTGGVLLSAAPLFGQEASGRTEARPEPPVPSFEGGNGADFTQLIQLIMTETSGGWITDGLGEGSMSQFDSGVRVDPLGVLYQSTKEEQTGRLAALGVKARTAALNEDMAQPSSLRMVSLTRLEREVAQRMAEGQPVVESMHHLAGLSKIQYVFVYPESGEIVIGGPAEGWKYDAGGRAVGEKSGTPTLQLDDFVTLWRTFDGEGANVFRCSIDPRPENLQKLQEFASASQDRGPLRPGEVKNWARKLGETLGRQDIAIDGVPANSRVARVIVEADYRMKLIGIGKLEGGSQVPDYFELMAKHPELAGGNLSALRWWMTLNCDEVLHSPDRNTFEIRGSSVKCQSENEFVSANGERIATGKAEPINRMFAENFTEHYSELAQREPAFADMQNVFDLALVTALLHHEGAEEVAHWNGGVFARDGGYAPASYPVPRQCDTVVNHRVFNGQDVVVQVAGGVRADVAAVINNEQIQHETARLDQVSDNAAAPELPAGRWWWDVK